MITMETERLKKTKGTKEKKQVTGAFAQKGQQTLTHVNNTYLFAYLAIYIKVHSMLLPIKGMIISFPLVLILAGITIPPGSTTANL